jgi:hypothetical protein
MGAGFEDDFLRFPDIVSPGRPQNFILGGFSLPGTPFQGRAPLKAFYRASEASGFFSKGPRTLCIPG